MFIFFTIVLTVLRLAKATLGCGDTLVGSPTTYNCGTPGLFTQSSLPQMPVGGKDIFVQSEIVIEDFCSLSPPYHFLTLSIQPTTGTQIKIMDIQWDGAKTFTLSSQDSVSVKTPYSVTAAENQPAGQWFSFTSWIRLGSSVASAIFTYYGTQSTFGGGASGGYGLTWTIDMTPQIFVCSGLNGASSVKCQVANLKVWYQAPTYFTQIRDGTTPNLIAQYKLNQYSGYKVTDSASNPLGTAYFGSSTASALDPVSTNLPSWVPEEDPSSSQLMQDSGIQFDQRTQYVTLPTFQIAQSLMTPVYSFTLKLWIKLSGTPSISSYVFQYSRANLVTKICGLQVLTNLKLQTTIYNSNIASATSISATNWNSIAITWTSFDYMNTPSSSSFSYYYAGIINNVPLASPGSLITTTIRYAYDPSNIVRLGGPPTVLGIIAGVEIYTPGSELMSTPTSCQSSTCQRDLGVTSPSTCLFPICATNCAACFNSQADGCLAWNSGYSLYKSQCISNVCMPGKYLDSGNNCQNCITNCTSCTDSISCNVCNTGLVYNGLACVCPSGTVLDAATNTCENNMNTCGGSSDFYYPSENTCKSTCTYPFKVTSGSPVQYCVLDIDEADSEQAEQVAKISTAASYATNLGGALVALLSSSNAGLLLIGSLTQMLSYIQYLNIAYPPKVYQMLYSQNVNSGGLEIITNIPPQVAQAIPNHPLPEVFAQSDTYSSFVANSWDFLISLTSILLSIGTILFIISYLLKSYGSGRIYSFLTKLLHSLRWNLFFGVLCSGYGFTGIFTALEFRTVNMDSPLSIMSFVICLIINTLGFCSHFLIVHLSMAFRTIMKTVKNPEERTKQIEEAEEKWKSYTVLFEDYKNDHISQKMFLFIFMFRTYIHYSILGYLDQYPFLQTCFFTVISISMILYLIIRRPMKGKMSYIQQMVCEIAILIVNICVLILASMDKWGINVNARRVKVGDVIVATNFGLSIAGSVFTVIEGVSQIKEAYLFIKSWLKGRKRTTKGLKIKRRGIDKPDKSFKPKHILDTESKVHEIEISDLEKSNDILIDRPKFL